MYLNILVFIVFDIKTVVVIRARGVQVVRVRLLIAIKKLFK